jgi:hypothetical protein
MLTHLVSSNVCEAFGDGQQFPQYRLISLDKKPTWDVGIPVQIDEAGWTVSKSTISTTSDDQM